jgi:integrase
MTRRSWSWPVHKARRPNTRVRVSLRLEDWPTEDRTKWQEATQPADLFDNPGSASHLGLRTLKGLIDSYGRWLGFLRSSDPHLLDLPVAERVTPALVEDFCRALAQTNSARGGAAVLHKMRHVLLHLAPGADWDWLHAIAKRIKSSSTPRSKTASLRMSDELYQLGFDLMDRAEAAVAQGTWIRERDALTYRDGLMIALLAADPIRRSNFASLTVHQSIMKTGSAWSIVLTAAETKGGRALEYPVPPRVGARLDQYLAHYRPVIYGSHTHTGLWASDKGCPMKGGAIYDAVCRRTKAAFGQRVYLHLFRDAAATFWSMESPEDILGTRDLLGHRSIDTTDQYYRHAQTVPAARRYAQIIERRIGPAASSQPGPIQLRRKRQSEPRSIEVDILDHRRK